MAGNRRLGAFFRRGSIVLAATMILYVHDAPRAQNRPGASDAPQGQAPAKPELPPPPYESRLLRLSELLGALSYLQPFCSQPQGENWRKTMQELLDAEAKTPNQRARLAGAFNTGFRGFELTYRTCTDNARLVIARYLTEGEKIARDVANRYGGG